MTNRPTSRLLTLATAAACIPLAACIDYTVETTVRPDGGGIREIHVEATDLPDDARRRDAYLSVTHLSEARGWTHERGAKEDGDSVFTFHRRTDVPDLTAWSTVSGDLTIDAGLPADADERVNYVRIGDVRFANNVRVGRGVTSDGTTTITYLETFVWEQALDLVAEFVVTGADRLVAERFPRLTPEERGQISGAFRTRIWMMVDAGILEEGADEEALTDEAIQAAAQQVQRVLRRRYPEAAREEIEELLREALEGDEVGDEFEHLTPGVDLGWNTSIEFRLRLPGEVTSSNADREEDGVLVWEFGPDDALLTPVEIRAEAVVGG
jgi:hypothetical protein